MHIAGIHIQITIATISTSSNNFHIVAAAVVVVVSVPSVVMVQIMLDRIVDAGARSCVRLDALSRCFDNQT